MDRTITIAPFALILALAVLFAGLVSISPANAADTAVTAAGGEGKHESTWRDLWTLGWGTWTETVDLTRSSDSQKFSVTTTSRAFFGALSYVPAGSALIYEGKIWLGQNASESLDPAVTYFKSNATVFAAEANAGWRTAIGKSRIQFGAYIGGLMRRVSFTVPAGYSFSPFEQRTIFHAKLEFAVPLGKSLFFTQQISIPLLPITRVGNIWSLGLRI